MIRVTRNDDISFNVDEIHGKGDRYNITFYTVNNTVNIVKHDTDVNDGIIVLNGSELMTLGEGVLNLRVDNIAPNAGYNDGIYNTSFTKTTKYYIQSGVIVPDGTDTETVMDVVANMVQLINNEVQRSTGQDNTHTTDIADLQSQIQALTTALQQAQATETSHFNQLYSNWVNDHYPFLSLRTTVENLVANVSENEEVQAAAFNELRQILRDNEETIAAALNNLQEQITE